MIGRGLLVLLLAATALAGRAPRERDPARAADARLRAGLPQVAIRLAEACLVEHPADAACAEVLGRAATFTGACDRGLAALALARAGGHWTARSATAEGVCRVRIEDPQGALAAFDEAAFLDPEDHGPWLQRALVDLRLGGDVAFDRAGLEAAGAPLWAHDLVELWRAYDAGEDVDGRIASARYTAEAQASSALRQHAALVDCHRWIEVGDPWTADTVARAGNDAVGGNARLHACRGEAVRLQGDPWFAERLVDRDTTGVAATPVLDAVLVRALVDQGRLDEAAALLADQPDPHADVAVASGWYLARARGDAAAVARLAAEAAALPGVPDRDLTRLIPIPERR